MAIARVCDKCGKTTTKYFYSISVEKCFLETRNHKDYISYSDKGCYELCPECMEIFENFMRLDKEEQS